MSATKKGTGTRTPMERRDAIYARLEELQSELEYRVNTGEDVGEVAQELAKLREELPAVLAACDNWKSLREAQSHRNQAAAYEARGQEVAAVVEDWVKRKAKLDAAQFDLCRQYDDLATEMEKKSGVNAEAFGPRCLSSVNRTIKTVRSFPRVVTDVFESVRRKKGKVHMDDIQQFGTAAEGIRGIPENFAMQTKVLRQMADNVLKGWRKNNG